MRRQMRDGAAWESYETQTKTVMALVQKTLTGISFETRQAFAGCALRDKREKRMGLSSYGHDISDKVFAGANKKSFKSAPSDDELRGCWFLV